MQRISPPPNGHGEIIDNAGSVSASTTSAAAPRAGASSGYMSPLERPSISSIRVSRSSSSSALGRHQFAVAQDRNPVADFEHLRQPVRDVENRAPLALERQQRCKDALDLDIGQCRRRLVENENARVARQQPRDLDELPLAHAERGNRSVEVDVIGSEQRQRLGGPPAKLRPLVQERNPQRAEPYIVLNRQIRTKTQLLRHDARCQVPAPAVASRC